MTRAGEKLYGDWERMHHAPKPRVVRRRAWRAVLTLVALLVVGRIALYGLG